MGKTGRQGIGQPVGQHPEKPCKGEKRRGLHETLRLTCLSPIMDAKLERPAALQHSITQIEGRQREGRNAAAASPDLPHGFSD
jgi:hypothetical protein